MASASCAARLSCPCAIKDSARRSSKSNLHRDRQRLAAIVAEGLRAQSDRIPMLADPGEVANPRDNIRLKLHRLLQRTTLDRSASRFTCRRTAGGRFNNGHCCSLTGGRCSANAAPPPVAQILQGQSRSGRAVGEAIQTALRRPDSPRRSATLRRGTPKLAARNAMSASFALPSTAGAASRTLRQPL